MRIGFRSDSSRSAPFRRPHHKCHNRLRIVIQGPAEQAPNPALRTQLRVCSDALGSFVVSNPLGSTIPDHLNMFDRSAGILCSLEVSAFSRSDFSALSRAPYLNPRGANLDTGHCKDVGGQAIFQLQYGNQFTLFEQWEAPQALFVTSSNSFSCRSFVLFALELCEPSWPGHTGATGALRCYRIARDH